MDAAREEFFQFFQEGIKGTKRDVPGKGIEIPDPVIRQAIDTVLDIQKPTLIVDYGCGLGRMPQAMNLLKDSILKKISYVGVDVAQDALQATVRIAKEIGFNVRVNSFSVMPVHEYYYSRIRTNLVFLIDVLHEIHLTNLPTTIHAIASHMQIGDSAVIYDLLQLSKAEPLISAWYPESLEMLFGGIGFHITAYNYATQKGHRVAARLTCVQPKVCQMSDVLQICPQSYSRSRELLDIEDDKETVSTRLAYLITSYKSMAAQMEEFQKWFRGEFLDNDSTSYTIKALTKDAQDILDSGASSRAYDWLIQQAVTKGRWGYCKGRPPRVQNTCEVLTGMIDAKLLRPEDEWFEEGINWVLGTKCQDGGFPSLSFSKMLGRCCSTTECTSRLLFLLVKTNRTRPTISDEAIKGAVTWLKRNYDSQSGGWGSWLGEPVRLFTTLWALRALNAAGALDVTSLRDYLNNLFRLESQIPHIFGFYPKRKAAVATTALSLMLMNELPQEIKEESIIKMTIEAAKSFIFQKQEMPSGLWIEEEEIRYHLEIHDGLGEPLKTPFHHFCSAYALEALLGANILSEETIRFHYALAKFLRQQQPTGYFRSLICEDIYDEPPANYVTASGLTILSLVQGAINDAKEATHIL